jgi:hypothetical protein
MRNGAGRWAAAMAIVMLAAAGGCGRRAPTDVQEVAAALRREGVAYDVSETAALGSISAGGLRLTGPGLDVELYVIGDKKDIQRILAAARLMAADQRSAGVAVPAKAYARGDLFVLVRAEPVEGGVGEALERISTE